VTTLLFVALDVPPADLEDDDPIWATARRVWRVLSEAGLTVYQVGQHLPGQDPLDVHADTIEALADSAGLAEPDELSCSFPGCTETFTQANHLKLHRRGHETKACQWCGRQVGAAGLASHERRCDDRPVEAGQRVTPPPLAREPSLPDRTPLVPDLGPIERRPFDPDAVRAAAAW
jgi:hypothetical protein